jgi:ribosome-binding protein aMBF1 (putative translation factor)
LPLREPGEPRLERLVAHRNDRGTAPPPALTQEELARRMNTTQTVIARLESGRVMPSTRTLERFARATGHRLRFPFEPLGERAEPASAGPPPEQAHAT